MNANLSRVPITKQAVFKVLKTTLKWIGYAHLVLFILIGVFAIYYINNNPSFTTLMWYRSEFKSTETPSFVPLRKVSPTFLLDLTNREDARFYEHWGFDIEAIKTARDLNKKAGYRAYGGSTLTQQLARTLFLTPHKNYLRKYLELLIAVELELILGKERILELYINYAELGDQVYGFNDASKHYYKRSFLKTTKDQKLRLIALLASPIRYSPYTLHKNRHLTKRYNFLKKYHKVH